jgi:hypothetical protein
MGILEEEIGFWTGEKGTLHLVPLWGRSISSPKLKESLFLCPFIIDVEYYLPHSSNPPLMWHCFQTKAWFYPRDSGLAAMKVNSDLDTEKLGIWGCAVLDVFLTSFPCWRSVFIFHDAMTSYAKR